MKKITAAALSLVLVAGAQACSDGNPSGPGNPSEPDDPIVSLPVRQNPPPGMMLSNATAAPLSGQSGSSGSGRSTFDRAGTSRAASAATVAYVSAMPGTFPGSLSAEVRNETTAGAIRPVVLIDGGFDPIGVDAEAGDELLLVVSGPGGVPMAPISIRVPPRRRPGVVRTNPPKGRTDVALSVQIIIVFSEPIDKSSVTSSSVVLLQDGNPVAGTLQLASDGLSVEFIPDSPLRPQAMYSLELGSEIRDLDGDSLGDAFVITFVTDLSSPLGELAFAQRADGQIYRMRLDGTGLTRLTDTGRNMRPKWSPDGQRIAFVRNIPGAGNRGFGSADVYTMDADGSNLTRRTSDTNFWWGGWSPDGRKLVVSNEGIYDSDIYVVNLDEAGSSPTLLATAAISPAWSRDGKQIAFVRISGDDGYNQIYAINPDGTGARALTEIDPGAIYGLNWSPDGQRIAFGKCLAGICNAYTINADGSGLSQITDVGTAQEAAWSPDGKWLAVSLWRYSGRDVDVTLAYVPIEGGAPRELIRDGMHPSWRP